MVAADQRLDQLLVGNITDHELGFRLYSPVEAGGEPVEDDHLLAMIE